MVHAPDALKKLAADWEKAIPSAVLSGIVGDKKHVKGYHLAAKDLPTTDYSRQLPGDRVGIDPDAAGALDMSMSPAGMKQTTRRIYDSWKNKDDPRLHFWREFIGTLDGVHVIYIDIQRGRVGTADKSHLWHVHSGGLRAHSNNPAAMSALLSVVTGHTVAQWRGTVPATGPPAPAVPKVPAAKKPVAAPTWPGRVIRLTTPNTHGADVRAWQRQMHARGWRIDTAGIFDQRTADTLRLFQAQKKLSVDGVLGPASWAAAWTAPIT